MEPKKYLVIRDVNREECPWFKDGGIEVIKRGEILYEFPDVYGCCGEGVMVSKERLKYPSFEMPTNSLEEFKDNFSLN